MNLNGGPGVSMFPVKSSNILGVGKDGDDLVVEFKGGSRYEFKGAAKHLEEILKISADDGSVGKWLNANIKGHYQSVKL